jgi:hypothetical protein
MTDYLPEHKLRDTELKTATDVFQRAKQQWITRQYETGRREHLSARFELWLLAQGAQLDRGYRPGTPFFRDILDVAAGWDILRFESTEQLSWFVLKYS